MASSNHNIELLNEDEQQQAIVIEAEPEPTPPNNDASLGQFYFKTSSKIQEPIDTSAYCHLHCRKQACGIWAVVLFGSAFFVYFKLGYFMVAALFVVISILTLIYACTVGYVCCGCFQRTRYDIRFNDNTKIVEVWSSSNKLFAEQEIPYDHVRRFRIETIEQSRIVYGNVIKGSYVDCAVIYVETLFNSLVRINKYFAIGDEIDHANHMVERLNKYWLKERFCRRVNE